MKIDVIIWKNIENHSHLPLRSVDIRVFMQPKDIPQRITTGLMDNLNEL